MIRPRRYRFLLWYVRLAFALGGGTLDSGSDSVMMGSVAEGLCGGVIRVTGYGIVTLRDVMTG